MTRGIGDEPNILLQNTGGSNNWLQLDLRGTVSNLDAIGARVQVTAPGLLPQVQEVSGGSGFFDQHMRILHFGLGSARSATVEIRWPNGGTQQLFKVQANQRLVVCEPGGGCPWDLDGNGSVSTSDLLDLLAQWGSDPGGPPDFNGDGTVSTTDLLELLANWGPCP